MVERGPAVYSDGTETATSLVGAARWLARDGTLDAATLQDLTFTRDPVGNITGITDDAHETELFANTQVRPDQTFSDDALYRLISATGREKVSQT